MSNDIFDAGLSKAAGEKGMALVESNSPDFAYQFHLFVLYLPHGWVGQCEDIRREWTGTIPHPNAWGACCNTAIRRGLLRKLPIEASMTAVKSHGRKTRLLQRV